LAFCLFFSFGPFIGCSFDLRLLATPLVSPSLCDEKKNNKQTNVHVKADHALDIWDIVATGYKMKNEKYRSVGTVPI
jgi:hypothetical protein